MGANKNNRPAGKFNKSANLFYLCITSTWSWGNRAARCGRPFNVNQMVSAGSRKCDNRTLLRCRTGKRKGHEWPRPGSYGVFSITHGIVGRRQAIKSHRILTGTFVCVSCTSVLTKHIQELRRQVPLVPVFDYPLQTVEKDVSFGSCVLLI